MVFLIFFKFLVEIICETINFNNFAISKHHNNAFEYMIIDLVSPLLSF